MSSYQPIGSILISGTSRGIGKYLAEYYLDRGFRVFGCSRSSAPLSHDAYRHFELDVSDEVAVCAMFSSIRKNHSRLDILINNAAVSPVASPSLLSSGQTLKRTMEVNFIGTFLLSREASKIMSRFKFGRIINIGSMAEFHQIPSGGSAYTASKAAVTAFTRVFSKEIYPLGITCNVIAPAAIPTDLSYSLNTEVLQEMLKRNAITGLGKLEDVSNVADWLIRPESQSITGQTIYLGGV